MRINFKYKQSAEQRLMYGTSKFAIWDCNTPPIKEKTNCSHFDSLLGTVQLGTVPTELLLNSLSDRVCRSTLDYTTEKRDIWCFTYDFILISHLLSERYLNNRIKFIYFAILFILVHLPACLLVVQRIFDSWYVCVFYP